MHVSRVYLRVDGHNWPRHVPIKSRLHQSMYRSKANAKKSDPETSTTYTWCTHTSTTGTDTSSNSYPLWGSREWLPFR
jgi:hypothetical protein